MSRTTRIILLAVFAAVMVGRLLKGVQRAADFHKHFGAMTFDRHFTPGLAASVKWLQRCGIRTVHGLQADADSYHVQRLSEMLYPAVYRPTDPGDAEPGAVFILEKQESLSLPVRTLFRAGRFRIVSVLP